MDVDDPGNRLDVGVVGLGGLFLEGQHPVGRLGHGVEGDFAHVPVLDQRLQVRRVVAFVALVLVDDAPEREEIGAQRRLPGALGRIPQRGQAIAARIPMIVMTTRSSRA